MPPNLLLGSNIDEWPSVTSYFRGISPYSMPLHMSLGLKKSLVIVAVIAVIVAATAGGWLVYQGVRVSLEAENTHQAYLRVLDALEIYVRKNNRQWPPNWEELSAFALKEDPERFDMLGDLDDVRQRVAVRFDLSADEVSKLKATNFAAAQPIDPSYGEDMGGGIERLIDACRER